MPSQQVREDIAPIPLSPDFRSQNEAPIRSEKVGARVLKKGMGQEMSPSLNKRGALTEDDFDVSGAEEEEGIVLLFSRRRDLPTRRNADPSAYVKGGNAERFQPQRPWHATRKPFAIETISSADATTD